MQIAHGHFPFMQIATEAVSLKPDEEFRREEETAAESENTQDSSAQLAESIRVPGPFGRPLTSSFGPRAFWFVGSREICSHRDLVNVRFIKGRDRARRRPAPCFGRRDVTESGVIFC
jgi:hypothetical protein